MAKSDKELATMEKDIFALFVTISTLYEHLHMCVCVCVHTNTYVRPQVDTHTYLHLYGGSTKTEGYR